MKIYLNLWSYQVDFKIPMNIAGMGQASVLLLAK